MLQAVDGGSQWKVRGEPAGKGPVVCVDEAHNGRFGVTFTGGFAYERADPATGRPGGGSTMFTPS